MRHPFALAMAASTVVLFIAGCGSSGSSSTSSSATSSSATTPAAPAASTSPTPTAAGVMISTKHAKLGTIIAAGPKHLTVYLFEADKGSASSCSGPCAKAWPPVTTDGEPKVAGSASAVDVRTITRTDGTKQVTYKGHPLYYFVKDGDAGDAYGQGVKGFGASWYVLAPSGHKVDNS